MLLDDLRGAGQPDARPGDTANQVGAAAEALEDVGLVRRRDTDALVAHPHHRPALGPRLLGETAACAAVPTPTPKPVSGMRSGLLICGVVVNATSRVALRSPAAAGLNSTGAVQVAAPNSSARLRPECSA